MDPSFRNSVSPLDLCTYSRASLNLSLCDTWPSRVQSYHGQKRTWSSGDGWPSPLPVPGGISGNKEFNQSVGHGNKIIEVTNLLWMETTRDTVLVNCTAVLFIASVTGQVLGL